MIQANELIKKQQERDNRKYITYDKIYNIIEKKIHLASTGDNYYIWYQIPDFLIGLPLYSVKGCTTYIQTKLKQNGFDTDLYNQNILLIRLKNNKIEIPININTIISLFESIVLYKLSIIFGFIKFFIFS